LTKLKRLALLDDPIYEVQRPISDSVLHSRKIDYPLLSPGAFAKKYRDVLYRGVSLAHEGKYYKIQMNHCDNPYCKWYGLDQHRFETIKGKPSRYRLSGARSGQDRAVVCNPDPMNTKGEISLNCTTDAISNWSIAEEIKRLATHDRIIDWEPDYNFHRETCILHTKNPFDNSNDFYRRGKSTGKSQKWQCKTCKKLTNVLPKRRETTTYHQKRNDILPIFAALILNRTPVKRVCEILEISSDTYYRKLEWMYRRCLEFLERHEQKPLEDIQFDSIWLNTDKLQYNLNNVRKKGNGSRFYDMIEVKKPQTHIVVTADIDSRYVFRSDVAYDWNITLENIERDTQELCEDHLHEFARKNARLRFSYAPQPPTSYDSETMSAFTEKRQEFDNRKRYIDGLHVNPTYTSIAHLWHLQKTIKTKKWRFVTDEDYSLMSAVYRVFSKEIKEGWAHHFLCKIDAEKTLRDAYNEYMQSIKDLKTWGTTRGYTSHSVRKLAFYQMVETLEHHHFLGTVKLDGKEHYRWGRNPLEHPLATKDKGYRLVDCTTDISALDTKYIANMLMKVNDYAVNNFNQQMRRRISILERPLVTARGDGKSYIYANFNPKYAQFSVTILRTYYNFCMTYKSGTERITPAQQLGLTNKKYSMKDIIYFK
jgi:transposase-like protein